MSVGRVRKWNFVLQLSNHRWLQGRFKQYHLDASIQRPSDTTSIMNVAARDALFGMLAHDICFSQNSALSKTALLRKIELIQ